MEILIKKCSKCQETKSIEEFHKDRQKGDGYRYQCKNCRAEDAVEYLVNNPGYGKKCRLAYRDKRSEYSKVYNAANLDKFRKASKKYRAANPDKCRKYLKVYRATNSDKIKAKYMENMKNLFFKLNENISSLIRISLSGNKNGCHWEHLVGYTLSDLKIHLEKQFRDGMSWENRSVWQIDHILPRSLWRFESYADREFKQCWSLCNLQPLWAKENRIKSNKTDFYEEEASNAK